jgi:hypothetical protein
MTNGRWRNGALIIQLVRRSLFGPALTNQLDGLTVQNPSDLKTVVVMSDGTQINLTENVNGIGGIQPNQPFYEVYGGLTVKNNAEFLYESTLFWHFGSISEVALGVKPCYGDPNWEAAYKVETQGITLPLFQALLATYGFADMAALEAALLALQGCINIDNDDGGCKDSEDYYDELRSIYNLGLLSLGLGGPGQGGKLPPTGLEIIDGSPVAIEGGISAGGVTSGPNFETGRRTWTDVLPQ